MRPVPPSSDIVTDGNKSYSVQICCKVVASMQYQTTTAKHFNTQLHVKNKRMTITAKKQSYPFC
jgi:hypothetical protein